MLTTPPNIYHKWQRNLYLQYPRVVGQCSVRRLEWSWLENRRPTLNLNYLQKFLKSKQKLQLYLAQRRWRLMTVMICITHLYFASTKISDGSRLTTFMPTYDVIWAMCLELCASSNDVCQKQRESLIGAWLFSCHVIKDSKNSREHSFLTKGVDKNYVTKILKWD